MPQRGFCADVTCPQELTELYECHCCSWLICLKHLLQHVEVTRTAKQKQLDDLRNDLTSVAYTLELLVEKKIHEIERGKTLIARAKAKLDTPSCPMEEMQQIFEEINQAIAADEREETIVKVESFFSPPKRSVCNNEASEENIIVHDFSSPTRCILEEIRSPVFNNRSLRSTRSASLALSKDMDHSTAMDADGDSSGMTDATVEAVKDEAGGDDREKRTINPRTIVALCPLISDGAFGLTRAKHQIRLCSKRKRKLSLLNHLKDVHKLTHVHALRICQAVANELHPTTTNLFGTNEMVVDCDHVVWCPFTNSMISLIGCCPTGSRYIPCQATPMRDIRLRSHLRNHHQISARETESILKTYKSKLSQSKLFQDNHPSK